jgi:hypothetical protein
MIEQIIAVVIALITGAAALTTRINKRIDDVDLRMDRLELKMAETYVTKETLYRMFDRLDHSLSRMEEKLDAHVFEDPDKLREIRRKYHD